MKLWLQDTEIYLIHNERNSTVVKRFIKTLMNKIYKYMSSLSKNEYIFKLVNMVNKYNNT